MSGPLFLLVLLQSFYWGLFSAVASFVGNRTRVPWVVALPVLWVAFEQLRSLGVIGFTWGALGYAMRRRAAGHPVRVGDRRLRRVALDRAVERARRRGRVGTQAAGRARGRDSCWCSCCRQRTARWCSRAATRCWPRAGRKRMRPAAPKDEGGRDPAEHLGGDRSGTPDTGARASTFSAGCRWRRPTGSPTSSSGPRRRRPATFCWSPMTWRASPGSPAPLTRPY